MYSRYELDFLVFKSLYVLKNENSDLFSIKFKDKN